MADDQEFVGGDVFEGVGAAIGPGDVDVLYSRYFPQAKMGAQIVVGEIAGGAVDGAPRGRQPADADLSRE